MISLTRPELAVCAVTIFLLGAWLGARPGPQVDLPPECRPVVTHQWTSPSRRAIPEPKPLQGGIWGD